MMHAALKPAALVAILAMAGGAAAAPAVGEMLGRAPEEIRAALTAQGYEVRKMEIEDGKTEVYAVKGSERLEIYVDPASGQVTRVKVK